MTDLEQQLRQENSEYLQEKIRTNAYREDVALIARRILVERKADVPIPETEEELNEKVKLSMHLSTLAFLTVAVWIAVVLIFQPSIATTVLFGIALLSPLAYLKSKNK